MTTVKIYEHIRSKTFSGNYKSCASQTKQVFTLYLFTAPRLSSRLLYYLKRKWAQCGTGLLKYKRTRPGLKSNKLYRSAEPNFMTYNDWNCVSLPFFRKLFAAFLLYFLALVVRLQVLLVQFFSSFLLFFFALLILLWHFCGFCSHRRLFLVHKARHICCFQPFFDGTVASRRKILRWAALAALISHIRSNIGIRADNRDSLNQSES